jgi:hypothetical protein
MRLTLDTAGRYRGLAHCLRTLVATEGMCALWRGLGPSLAAIFPEAAITYGARAHGLWGTPRAQASRLARPTAGAARPFGLLPPAAPLRHRRLASCHVW